MPLSFSTENAGKDGLSADINYEFPGKIATWEWQEGIEGSGIKSDPIPLKYRFSNPDSVMTLAVKSGKVGAIKYAQAKENSASALALKPMTVQGVALTAADLNSMFIASNASELFKLTFNPDVSKGSSNLWTSEYKAVEAQGENVVNQAVLVNSKLAVEDAKKVNTNAYIADLIRTLSEEQIETLAVNDDEDDDDEDDDDVNNNKYTDRQIQVLQGIADEAADAKSFLAAVDAVKSEKSDFTDLVTEATAQLTDANTLKDLLADDKELGVATGGALKAAVAVDKVVDVSDADNSTVRAAYAALGDVTPYSLKAAKESAASLDAGYTTAKEKADADKEAADIIAAAIEAFTYDASWTDADKINAGLTNQLIGYQTEANRTMVSLAINYVRDNATSGIDDAAYEALRDAAAAAVTTVYANAVTTAEANVTLSANLLTAVDALKGVNTVGEYKTAVAAATVTSTEDLKAEVLDEFIALVDGKEDGDAYTKPSSNDQDAVIAVFTENEELAKADLAAATDAETAALAVDKTHVANAITSFSVASKYANMSEVTDAFEELAEVAGDVEEEGNESVATAIAAAVEALGGMDEKYPSTYDGYLSLQMPNSTENFLRVDTTFLTGNSGNKHLTFASGKLNPELKTTKGLDVAAYVQHDYNARYNFQFTYYPTEDSLVIKTPLKDEDALIYRSAGFAHPLTDVKYLDMSNQQMVKSWELHTVDVNGTPTEENIVKIVVLNDATKHREVTIGADELIENSAFNKTTLNTRIGLNVAFAPSSAIPAGVYTIQYVSNDKTPIKVFLNGRYITHNWLLEAEGGQFMATVEDQDLNHIPAAQWIVTQAKGENLNSIINRETAAPLMFINDNGRVQEQYMYATTTKNLYTNMSGDSLLFTPVPEEFTKDVTLGYFANPEDNKEAADQLTVFSLKYLNDLNSDLFVGYSDKDSILNVAKTDAEDLVYFRLIRATDSLAYGASANGVAKELKRMAYYLQLETPNKNVKDEDKLFIASDKNGKFKLVNSTLTNGKVNYNNIDAFFLKEFKEADTHYYALIEADKDYETNTLTGELGKKKISVKDYPSILIVEDLEGENGPQGVNWDYYGTVVDGRTSTFALIAKDAPKYRRLGVTDPEDGLKNLGTNVAKINVTREDNRYLYENTTNKVAGYDADPTGLNYLGALFNGANKAAMFIDTAYVRNETARPQYLLAVRPDFTPDTTFCPVNHGHAYELVDQVRANYLVTLSDSVAAYAGNKPMLDKFMYESRTYTRLAFVDAIHQGDSLVIMDSKFKGTKDAKNDTIDLSKNGFNNAAVQFRLTKNDDQKAEFYIETQNNEFVRLVNGIAVLTEDIADAERFNIAKTDDKPVANEGINASEVSVIAGNGNVTINGAAGKKVTISNVLGQTIANTVLSSDNATIAAPAGVVVVAVDGEAAVKAIVK